ncbi:MAG: LexA family transcriptional regulator [Bacteroidia bacterium]|jgi:transcriptional regulator with XRE-family HTH domain|nr:LexA family transcriptional regulator [Bacteroidia bacterium]
MGRKKMITEVPKTQGQTFFSSNLRLLRKRRGLTQDELALALGMPRSTLSNYENQLAEPPLEALIAFGKHFNIAIDTLLQVDLQSVGELHLRQLERGFDVYIKGSQLRVLATTVDSNNNENVELVDEKAKAGYANGFADPEYIKVLPAFNLPFLSRNKKYRTFQISGDSMLPIPDKSFVTGEYVVDWNHIRNHQPYIILTRDEGIVFKIVENRIADQGKLILHSLNPEYQPYELSVSEVREVWKFVHYIASQMPQPANTPSPIEQQLSQLQREVKAIQLKLNI